MKKIFNALLGRIPISKEVMDIDNLVMHISDTPLSFYPELKRIITLTNPKVVIHTGDLCDDIKIGLQKKKIDLYAMNLRRLHQSIKEFSGQLVIVTGNHDNMELVKEIFGYARIFKSTGQITLNGKQFNMNHAFEKLDDVFSDYHLYGHSPEKSDFRKCGQQYLNGLNHINFIDLDSGKIYQYHYPKFVNDSRMNKYKAGL